MAHTVIIVNDSLLEIFDPAKTEYAGVRDHFSTSQLAEIDALRARPHPTSYTVLERGFICWAIDRAVMTAENET